MSTFAKFINNLVLGSLSLVGLISILYIAFLKDVDPGIITFNLLNKSGKTIESAKIMLSDRECSASKILMSGNFKCYFGSMSDNSYQVTIALEDGTIIKNDNFGYVTSGMDFHHTATLTKENKLELELDK